LAIFKKKNPTPIRMMDLISSYQVGQHPIFYPSTFDGIQVEKFGFN